MLHPKRFDPKDPQWTALLGRWDQIKRSLEQNKIDPDVKTAAALCYGAMKLLGIEKPEEILAEGPLQSIGKIFKNMEKFVPGEKRTRDPESNEEMVTLPQREIWLMLEQAEARGRSGKTGSDA